jgi:hypothetical protein
VFLKRAALAAGALLVSLLLLEVGARVLHRVRGGESFGGDALRERLAPAEDLERIIPGPANVEGHRGVKFATKVLHPYLGYVFDHAAKMEGEQPVNRFGFPGIDPLSKQDPDVVRVVVAGGSVALQLYRNGGEALTQALESAPGFAGKRIELVCLALGGYKQPQQLMALSWLMSLGAKFDLVINLDGFNEVVLPKSDNVRVGVHASFPRSWDFYQMKAAHASETRRLLREQREWRESLGTGLAARSVFVLTILGRLDARISEELAAQDERFRAGINRGGLGFQATGPFRPYKSEKALFAELVSIWKESSRQMNAISADAGIRYFHFLQPNQWVPGAKPLSGIERNQLRVKGPFTPREVVPVAYPLLGRAGAQLRLAGVPFYSLVRLFGEDDRTVYRDTCCHFNRLGITTIAEEIARVISEKFERERKPL